MALVVSGQCNKCGFCCRVMCKAPFMLNAEGVCKFLDPDNLCAIQAERVIPTDEQMAYWKKNCETYPAYLVQQDATMLVPYLQRVGWPSESCGFSVEVTDGDGT